MPDITPNLGLKKPLGNETVSRAAYRENLEIMDENAAKASDLAAHLADIVTVPTANKIPRALASGKLDIGWLATTADITLYVNAATGNDANDGLTAGTALKTIQAAINKIPQIVNHIVTVSVTAGTYTETITVSGSYGKGMLYFAGAEALADTHIVNKINCQQNSCRVIFRGFKVPITTENAVVVGKCLAVTVSYCKIDAVSGFSAIEADQSNLWVANSVLSNHSEGIYASLSRVYSEANSGSGNTTGLWATRASVIGKLGTQPGGTTAESTYAGGVIR